MPTRSLPMVRWATAPGKRDRWEGIPVFGLGGCRIVVKPPRCSRRREAGEAPRIVVKGRWDPLAEKLADFLRSLPVRRGAVRIRRTREGQARLEFSADFDERLAQRIRNYALSLSSR